MKIKNIILKIMKAATCWSLIAMSFFTMTFSELARAKEVETFTKSHVIAAIKQTGLDKDITFGEFYKKNKHLFPVFVQKEIEPFLKTSSHMKMPRLHVSQAKGNDGEVIPVVSTTVNGKLINIQFPGDPYKFIKFQNTSLTEIDVYNFTDMVAKVWNGDENIRKLSGFGSSNKVNSKLNNKLNSKDNKTFANFKGFPAVDFNLWKKLTITQRAAYLIQMRHMYTEARRVNLAFSKANSRSTQKGKKTADYPYLEKLFHSLVMQEASAKGRSPQMTSTDPRYEGNCVVAGYISSYEDNLKYNGGKRGCSVDLAIRSSSSEYIKKANAECTTPGSVACNPLIYGYESNGSALCVGKGESEFQQATHWMGPCDTKSRLTSDAVTAKVNFDKDGKYDTSEEAHAKQKSDVLNDPNSIAETKRFIASVFANGKKTELANLLNGNALTKENFETLKQEINAIGSRFNEEITKAIGSCEAQVNNAKGSVAEEQKLACDQLHRRYLNIEGLIKEIETHIPVQVTPPVTEPPKPKPDLPAGDCETQYPLAGAEVGASGKCVCANGKEPKQVGSDSSGAQAWSCDGKGDRPGRDKPGGDKPGKGDNDCGFMCKLWGGLKTILPFAIIGIGIYAMYRVMKPKVPSIASAGDICANGTVACTNTCGTYQVLLSTGGCGCPVCYSGTITDSTTCTCSSSTTTTSSSSSTTSSYTCWDGSVVANSISCPTKTNTETNTNSTGTSSSTGR